jgi:hypothetical protein
MCFTLLFLKIKLFYFNYANQVRHISSKTVKFNFCYVLLSNFHVFTLLNSLYFLFNLQSTILLYVIL